MTALTALPTATGINDLDWLVVNRGGREASQQDRKITRANLLSGVAFLAGSAAFTGAVSSAISLSAPAGSIDALTVATGLTMGAALQKILTATASVAIPTLATLVSSDVTMTVTGAVVGDVAIVNPQVDMPDGLHLRPYVSATNTVTINVNNGSNASITGASYSLKAVLLRVA
jgi:hypothetical protein